MTKWRYGLADFTSGTIEAHGEYMNDMQAESKELAQFLMTAGEKGWELCGVLPEEKNSTLVFKRSLSDHP